METHQDVRTMYEGTCPRSSVNEHVSEVYYYSRSSITVSNVYIRAGSVCRNLLKYSVSVFSKYRVE